MHGVLDIDGSFSYRKSCLSALILSPSSRLDKVSKLAHLPSLARQSMRLPSYSRGTLDKAAYSTGRAGSMSKKSWGAACP